MMRGIQGQQVIFTTMIGTFIFFLVITIFFEQLFISPNNSEGDFESVQQDAVRAADNLMNAGYPRNWTNETVQWFGLVDNGKLNLTKIQQFNATINKEGCPGKNKLSKSYQQSKNLLGIQIQHDYLVVFEAMNNTFGNLYPNSTWNHSIYCVNDGTSTNPQSEKDIVALEPKALAFQERIILLENATGFVAPVSMKVYVYQT